MKKRVRSFIAAATAAASLGITGMAWARAGQWRMASPTGGSPGRRVYAYYGFVRVEAMVRGGRLANVRVLEYPHDNSTSRYINGVALPYLIQEAVGAQSSRVDLISGATFTSDAFARSLRDALARAGE